VRSGGRLFPERRTNERSSSSKGGEKREALKIKLLFLLSFNEKRKEEVFIFSIESDRLDFYSGRLLIDNDAAKCAPLRKDPDL